MKIIYTAIFFDDNTKSHIKDLSNQVFNSLLEEEKIHHVTISFGSKTHPMIGKEVSFNISGYAKDTNCQAFVVSCSDVTFDNKIPHITVAHSSKVKPVYSNTLLQEQPIYNLDRKYPFTGRIGYFVKDKYSEGIVYENL